MNQDLYESLSKKAAQLMPKDRLNPYDYSLYMKILAELIVEECINICISNRDNDSADHIEKHFGVEE
jgi:hypothetical protein